MSQISSIEKARLWANNPTFDQESRNEIQQLIDDENSQEIEERFYKDLEFGTGGMRAILGQGTYRLNKYNIRKASTAVALAVLESNPKNPKIAISYDSRHFSFEFAKEAAGVFASHNIKALIYNRLNPVPLCSYAIRHHNCQAGVMVTASHNPPEYNGFKVFWADGAQVTPPNDKNIIDKFNALTDYSALKFMDFDLALKEKKIQWLDEETENLYFDAIKSKSLNRELCLKKGNELKIVYTALHGTGLVPCTRALNDLGLSNLEIVQEQALPDGSFPTVSSPNPENPEALSLGVDLMKKTNADICLGTDPDTDRVGIALIHEGETRYLNGNQIGILMLHYVLSQMTQKGLMPESPYFVKTIVTTPLQEKIAAKYNVETENTLTGFKWICGRVEEIKKEAPHRNFVFGTEESFGYLNHEFVRDKDGVSSVALLSEIALFYKLKGMNLFHALDSIYEEFGFSHETLLSLNYKGKEGAEKIARIMNQFRETPPSNIAGEKVENIKDYLCEKGLPPSNALGFFFESGNRLFLRPSGTEPKIKFYIMISENEGDLSTKRNKANQLTDQVLKTIHDLCQSA